MKKLMKKANPNIEFLGRVNDQILAELYSKAKALIFPQIEDFGLTPIEAMASGCPVIAYAQGGALETIIDQKTGLFFHEQNSSSLLGAIEKFNQLKFDPGAIQKHAATFDKNIFNKKILDFIEKKWETWEKEMT